MQIIYTLKLLSGNDATILTEKSSLLMENHYHELKFLTNLCQSLESDAYRNNLLTKAVKHLKAQLAYLLQLCNYSNINIFLQLYCFWL